MWHDADVFFLRCWKLIHVHCTFSKKYIGWAVDCRIQWAQRIVTSTVCRIRVNIQRLPCYYTQHFLDTNVNTSFVFITDYRYLFTLKNLQENAVTDCVVNTSQNFQSLCLWSMTVTVFIYFRLPDSWVLESQAATMESKVVPLASLPHDTISDLHPSLYAQHRHRKQRRK